MPASEKARLVQDVTRHLEEQAKRRANAEKRIAAVDKKFKAYIAGPVK